jgi:hypothetical protein
MTQTLPKPIAEYIEATNTFDSDRLIAAFADDALVNDARREFWGTDAIKRWRAGTRHTSARRTGHGERRGQWSRRTDSVWHERWPRGHRRNPLTLKKSGFQVSFHAPPRNNGQAPGLAVPVGVR